MSDNPMMLSGVTVIIENDKKINPQKYEDNYDSDGNPMSSKHNNNPNNKFPIIPEVDPSKEAGEASSLSGS